jgi:hypothetical protein
MKNAISLVIFMFVIAGLNTLKAQNVSIPDANFKAALVASVSINTNADGEIQLSEAITYTGAIRVNSLSISSLTGIQAFTSITGLTCSGNQITSLNVSSNPALTYIYCDHNQLTSLVLTGANSLDYLYCGFNQLTSLNASSNPALATLYCWNNQLTGINVSGVTALAELYCHHNQLTGLNLSSSTVLDKLWANDNPLTGLDLSANSNLTWLQCGNSPLSSLNIQNGNNSNLTQFNLTNAPNLSCIQVDNASYMNSHWPGGKDASASFNTDCASTAIDPLTNNTRELLVYPNPSVGVFTLEMNHLADVETDVYDLVGKCIYRKHSSAILSQSIDLSNASKGVYFIKVSADDHQTTKKIMIE